MSVSGKRKRREATVNPHAQRRQGRPLQSHAEHTLGSKGAILNKLRQHHMQSQRELLHQMDKLSSLEKLPVELIQQIFFHALEVNLPRASSHLRRVLSTEPIFNALVVFAYFDDDGENAVEMKHFLPADYQMLECAEKVRLQQALLSCRWCTYERIKSCLPALSRLIMVQAWHQEYAMDESHDQGINVAHGAAIIVANEAVRDLAALPNLDEESKLEQHFLARTMVNDLGNSQSLTQRKSTGYLPRIVTWTSSSDDKGIVHKGTDRSLSTLASRHIPEWLLCSVPWTEERLKLLQLLREGYTFIQEDHVMSISARALFSGMRNAIREQHVTALKTLLELHNVFFKSGAWTIRNMMASQLTPSSHHPLPLDLFHLAIEQESHTTEMMSLLVRAGIDSLPRDDVAVTAWTVHGLYQGNALASWLSKHMEGTTDYGLPRRGHLFVDGCLSWRARARGNFPFPETSFATELGYIAGTPVVPAGIDGRACGFDS